MKLKKVLSFLLAFCLVFTGTVLLGSQSVSAEVYGETFSVETDSITLNSGESTSVKVTWLDDCTLVVDTDNENVASVDWYGNEEGFRYVKIIANENAKGQCIVTVYNEDDPEDSLDINVIVNTNKDIAKEPASKAAFKYKKVDVLDSDYEFDYSYDDPAELPEVYFKKVILTDNTNAAKKINKAIESQCKRFYRNESLDSFYEYFFDDYTSDRGDYANYVNYVNAKVTYNDNYVISIKYTEKWYAGGVSNTNIYGRTYSLKTGERLYFNDVTNLSLSKIKKQLSSKVKKSYGKTGVNKIKKIKSKKSMNFYLVPGKKAYITFKPYQLGYGGNSAVYKIKSKYA